MAYSPLHAIVRAISITLLLTLALLLLLLAPQRAHAAAPYTGEAMRDCSGQRGSGQFDQAGNTYVPCKLQNGVERGNVRVYDANGTLARIVAVPALPSGGRGYLSDVAPSPDGAYLYVAEHGSKSYYRLNRQADLSYQLDPTWKLARFTMNGGTYDPRGEFISTDATGNIYVATGAWVAAFYGEPYTIVKYRPDGSFITRFGEGGGDSWAPGRFYWMLTGLAATSTGTSVYTTEVGNNRVQRFDMNMDGSYRAAAVWGNSPADGADARGGICGVAGKFAAPYDVGLDANDTPYVISTTCAKLNRTEVHKLVGGTWQLIITPKFNDDFQHAVAVSRTGTIYIPSADLVMRPTGAPEPPPADVTAPELQSFAGPATATLQTVTLQLQATDNVGVTQMRLANENQNLATQPWKPFSAAIAHELTAGNGVKVVSAQVRDAAGNLSAAVETRITLAIPAPEVPVEPPVVQPVEPPVNPPAHGGPNTAPVLNTVTVPATSRTQTIALQINATDDTAVTEVRFATEDGNWRAWEPFTANTTFALSPNLGIKGVFTQVRDAQHAESKIIYHTLQYVGGGAVEPPVHVNAAPVLRAVVIPDPTQTRVVPVRITATDDVAVTQMRLAGENGAWTEWIDFDAAPTIRLTEGAGLKHLFVQVRDAQLAESTVIDETTVFAAGGAVEPPVAPPVNPPAVDTAPVVVGLGLPVTTASRVVTLAIDARDDVGVAQMRLANENGIWGAWQPFQARPNWTLTPVAMTKGVFVQVKDAAGHESNIVFKTTLCAPCQFGVRARSIRALRSARQVRPVRGSMRSDRFRASRLSQHFDLSQRDGHRDIVYCGAGYDTVLRQPGDRAYGCNRVITIRMPKR